MKGKLFLLALLTTAFSYAQVSGFYLASYAQGNACSTLYEDSNAANICNEANSTTGWTNNNTGDSNMASQSGNANDGTYSVNYLMDGVTAANRSIMFVARGVDNTQNVTISVYVSVTQGTDFRLRLQSGDGWSSNTSGSTFTETATYTEYTITGTATQDDPSVRIQTLNGYSLNDEVDIDSISWTVN